MTMQQASAVMADLAAAGMDVWLDGGWCVDALVGRQLREHDDIDLAVPHAHETRLLAWIHDAGYTGVPSADESPWNYVVENPLGHRLDIHVYEHDEHGEVIYGVAYPLASLAGMAMLGDVPVHCIDPVWQFRFKTGYTPREKDLIDVAALAQTFGFEVPESHRIA
jgi:lincosamide nucleotidyltransferase A/C/D/E